MEKKKKIGSFGIFLIAYSAIILVVISIGLIYLNGLLKDYDTSLPNNVMKGVVEKFTSDNIGSLLEESKVELSRFEKIDVVVENLQETLSKGKASFRRKAGEYTDAKPVFVVSIDKTVIAKVSLEKTGENSHGFDEWKVGDISFSDSVKADNKVTIVAPEKAIVTVNGVLVSDEFKKGDDKLLDESKNISEYTDNIYFREYEITGLIQKPEIEVSLEDKVLSFEEEDGEYFFDFPANDELLESQKEHIEEINRHYGMYIINRGNLDKLKSFMVGKAKEYISDIPAVWAYLWGDTYTYEFQDMTIDNMKMYSENCFSCKTYFNLYVDYHKDDVNYPTDMEYIFVKIDGEWFLADFIIN